MSGIEIHREPNYAFRSYMPCAPAMTFDVADPVQINVNQLADCNDDTTEMLITEFCGWACEPAEGIHAGSRAVVAADGFGVVENQSRSFWMADAPGLLLRTRNYYATGDTATQTEKEGTEIGDLAVMTSPGVNVWGLEQTAPTAGADIEFQIMEILDENMNPIDADATTALGTAPALGEGWLVFRFCRTLLSELTEGGTG